MQLENQFFISKDYDTMQIDYANWKHQFNDYIDYQKDGYQFCLVNDEKVHKIVLYVVEFYFYRADILYVMEVSAMEEFKNIEDAQARCGGIIEYYTRGKMCPMESAR